MENVESYKDEMYQLLQNPTRENFIKVVFKGLGELDNLEYKREWISEQNYLKSYEAEEGCIFYRRGTKTVKANMQEIKEMINKRLEAEQNGKSNLELEESLKQLQTLYNFIEPTTTSSSYFSALMKNTAWIGISKLYESKNPYYPKENYDKFIANMIEKKKLQIEQILKLSL